MPYGPTKPPMLPIELISAIPAAAPAPCTNDVASVQNGPSIEVSPSIAIDSSTSDGTRPDTNAVAMNAPPLTAAASATCHRRSPVRSE